VRTADGLQQAERWQLLFLHVQSTSARADRGRADHGYRAAGTMAAFAESVQGISPRASHRSGLEPLDSSGSCHRTKAAAFYRLSGSSCLSVGPIQRHDRPLRSTDITQLHHYYRAVRPYPAHRYFRPREHFDRKLPAVFASHCPFDAFDDGGNRIPIVLELLSAMLPAEPGLTTLPDNIAIGLPCVQLPGVNDLLPLREQKCRLNL
jgi:hypothetical protein